jgi:pimeloyl-ACP methyl ester carboxylesterase
MSVSPPAIGPRPRDELVTWSTAAEADVALERIPDYAEPSPDGFTVAIGGQDVFVRHTAGAQVTTDGRQAHAWFVHGLGGASSDWNRLAAALSGMATGLAMDLPGSGRSGPPARGDYSVTTEADLCAELIHRVSGRPVHLVANSRGGVVATFLAARHPELVTTLTLIAPAVPDLRLVGERGADAKMALVLLPGTLRLATRALAGMDPGQRASGLAAMCFGEPEALTDTDLAAAEREFAERNRAPWISEATVRSLRSLIRAQVRPGRWSFGAAARAVRVPTLVVWGTRDRLVDVRLARRTTHAFSDSRLLILSHTGHVEQMERPAATARAMAALWRTRQASGAPSASPTAAVAP